jgi:hypothetical protein
VRRLLLGFAFVALMLPACATADRPEGIVERWLLSLNHGAAGEPERYAPDDLSEQVLPNWDGLEPGELDVIEVSRGAIVSSLFAGDRYVVPFRVVTIDGEEFRPVLPASVRRHAEAG